MSPWANGSVKNHIVIFLKFSANWDLLASSSLILLI